MLQLKLSYKYVQQICKHYFPGVLQRVKLKKTEEKLRIICIVFSI
jgi:hypothetical protein